MLLISWKGIEKERERDGKREASCSRVCAAANPK